MRLPGWEARLAAAIDMHRHLPFGWGVSDCFILTMDAVAAIAGKDLSGPYRDYETEIGAAKMMRRFGYGDIGASIAGQFSFKEIAPMFAGRGDIMIISQQDKIACAICIGTKIIGKAQSGLTFTSRSHAIRAFRV